MAERSSRVLVVGGSGYVGSAVSAWLMDQGHTVVVLDNLSTGHLKTTLCHHFVRGNAGDIPLVQATLKRFKIECVLHFAGLCIVSESVLKPDAYFQNNVVETEALMEAMVSSNVTRLVFSSTCTIFKDAGDDLIAENAPKGAIAPYGATKLEAESRMEKWAKLRGLKTISLRYFNAAGTEPKLRTGEWHETETHLIPNILRAAETGAPVTIYGTDYPTPDGTAIRDYVHVTDLAVAHERAMQLLLADRFECGSFEGINLGSGQGHSVKEIIASVKRVTGLSVQTVAAARRPGDLARMVAGPEFAEKRLGFTRKFDMDAIIKGASQWQDKMSSRTKAVFLDRDGTLNPDPGYIDTPEQFELYPGVPEALKQLQLAGFKLVVVSNQSGVGRGLIKPEDLKRVHAKLDHLLEAFAVQIDDYSLCIHHPDDGCECRKPKPKLITDAAARLGVDLGLSYMVGDKKVDWQAGLAAGCRATLIVQTGEGKGTQEMLKGESGPRFFKDLAAAAAWIAADSIQL